MKKHFLFFVIVALSALVASSCKSKGDFPGRVYMPDMQYSNAYEAYSSTKFQYQSDTDAMSALLPVEGTIPRGYLPSNEDVRNDEAKLMAYLFKNYFENPITNPSLDDAAERARAAAMLKNPIKKSDKVLAEGKAKYDIYCAVCHGKKGQGDGPLIALEDKDGNKTGEDGPYTAVPPTYENRLPGLSDGEIFYSISYGKNMMGGYYSQVSDEDRWKILHYIKDMAGIEDANAVAHINIDEIKVEAGAQFNVPDIFYNTGSAELRSESFEVLDQLVAFFDKNPNVEVELGSHADARGDFNKNMTLSEQRANSAVKYLVSKGVNASQLVAKGYGSTMPAVNCGENCSEEDYQKNRRTTFKIVSVN